MENGRNLPLCWSSSSQQSNHPRQVPLVLTRRTHDWVLWLTVFTKLDLRKSYLQVPLAGDSRYLTAFVSHDGFFQYKRMPYGLLSAPSAFHKILSSILAGIKGSINIIDGITVHGKDLEERDWYLNEVLSHLNEHNLSLNKVKRKFAVSEVDFTDTDCQQVVSCHWAWMSKPS